MESKTLVTNELVRQQQEEAKAFHELSTDAARQYMESMSTKSSHLFQAISALMDLFLLLTTIATAAMLRNGKILKEAMHGYDDKLTTAMNAVKRTNDQLIASVGQGLIDQGLLAKKVQPYHSGLHSLLLPDDSDGGKELKRAAEKVNEDLDSLRDTAHLGRPSGLGPIERQIADAVINYQIGNPEQPTIRESRDFLINELRDLRRSQDEEKRLQWLLKPDPRNTRLARIVRIRRAEKANKVLESWQSKEIDS